MKSSQDYIDFNVNNIRTVGPSNIQQPPKYIQFLNDKNPFDLLTVKN